MRSSPAAAGAPVPVRPTAQHMLPHPPPSPQRGSKSDTSTGVLLIDDELTGVELVWKMDSAANGFACLIGARMRVGTKHTNRMSSIRKTNSSATAFRISSPI